MNDEQIAIKIVNKYEPEDKFTSVKMILEVLKIQREKILNEMDRIAQAQHELEHDDFSDESAYFHRGIDWLRKEVRQRIEELSKEVGEKDAKT